MSSGERARSLGPLRRPMHLAGVAGLLVLGAWLLAAFLGAPAAVSQSWTVSGVVWSDTDLDGRRDTGEPGVPGAVIKVCPETDVTCQWTFRTVIADATGAWRASIDRGTTYVWLQRETGWFVTTPWWGIYPGAHAVTVSADVPAYPGRDFGTASPTLSVTVRPETQQVSVGGTARFEIIASNTGATALTGVQVGDNQAPDCARTLGTLEPGARIAWSCSRTGVDADLGTNAHGVATWPSRATFWVDAYASVDVIHDAGRLVAVRSGSAVARHGDRLSLGLDVSYQPGADGSPATGVTLDDPICPPVAGPLKGTYVDPQNDADGYLEPGETWRWNCSLTIPSHTGDERDPLRVTATVTGRDLDGDAVERATSTHEVDILHPDIAIRAAPAPGAAVLDGTQQVFTGGTARYRIEVENTGDAPLTGVAVKDPDAVDCERAIGTLGPGATAGYDCTQPGMTADATNTATVSGLPAAGASVEAKSRTSVNVLIPAVAVIVRPSTQDAVVGTAAPLTIRVSNDGDSPLTGTVVTVDGAPDCDRTLGRLDPGAVESWGCATPPLEASAAIVATVVGRSEVPGLPGVTGPELSATDAARVTLVRPALKLTVGIDVDGDGTPDASPAAHHGATVEIRYRVTNTGEVPLTDVAVADGACSPVEPLGEHGTLEPGATMRFGCSMTIPERHRADEDDPITTAAWASASGGGVGLATTQVAASLDVLHDEGVLVLVLSATPSHARPGSSVRLDHDVAWEPGSDGSPAASAWIEDSPCTEIDGPDRSAAVDPDNDADGLLEAGETWRFTCEMPAADDATLLARARARDLDGDPVEAPGSRILDALPVLRTRLEANRTSVVAPGDAVTWTIEVENRSAPHDVVTVSALTARLAGDLAGRGDCLLPALILPGESWTCSVSTRVEGVAGTTATEQVEAVGADEESNPAVDRSSELSVAIETPAGPVRIGVEDAIRAEPLSGSARMIFRVRLDAAASVPITVRAVTADGTATAGLDYEAVDTLITFAPGQLMRRVVVPVLHDAKDESAETFGLRLDEPVGGDLVDPEATGMITDCTIMGTAGADTLIGTEAADVLCGLAGDDLLGGSDGDDQLRGGRGADVLDGGPGADRLDGGGGRDRVTYARSDRRVVVDLVAGTATVGRTVDRLLRVEDVDGSVFDDLVIGTPGANRLRGLKGADTIRPGDGDDDVDGGPGPDTLSYADAPAGSTMVVDLLAGTAAGLGADSLRSIERVIGGPGDDTLVGDGRVNVLQGGRGADTLEGGERDDRLSGGVGVDRLDGGPGGDVLLGGRDDDTLFAGLDEDLDTLDGGPGMDDCRAGTADVVACELRADEPPSVTGPAGGLAISVAPPEEPVDLHAALPGQRFVWLVSVSDAAGDQAPVTLEVMGDGLASIEAPATLRPGEVVEVVVVPAQPIPASPFGEPTPSASLGPDGGPEVGSVASVTIVAVRGEDRVETTRTMPLWPEEDLPPADAVVLRDRFVAWLAEAHPELGIDATTAWQRVPAGARILVVEHELFFSDTWEMGVSWHVMIAPDDWAEVYLRHRGDELAPSLAARIGSVSAGDEPLEIVPPGVVRR